MLDLVPFAGARRKVADLQCACPTRRPKSCSALFHNRLRLLLLPPPSAVIISSVACRKPRRAHLLPPAPDARGRRTRPCRDRSPRSPSPRCWPGRKPRRESPCPVSGPGKSWTLTFSGWPWGCHSCPGFLNSPTNSFFFVSTEITGWPPLDESARTCRLMYSNWALRSGCDVPSRVLRLACKL